MSRFIGGPLLCMLSLAGTLQAGSTRFERGDSDGNRSIQISDAVTIFGYLFLGHPQALSCTAAADSNGDQKIDLTDGVYILGYLFLGGPAPGAPFPACGADPVAPGLGCDVYAGCEGGNQPPVASFTATPELGAAPLDVTFDASGSTDVDGTIASYSWDFGDGEAAAGAVVTHTFAVAGSPVVTLTVVDDGGAAASATKTLAVTKPGDAPSSYALIQAALESGEINEETALIYRTFVVFDDPRLPARFQGGASDLEDSSVPDDLVNEIESLSANAQAILAPFLLPPAAAGSWLELREDPGAGGGGSVAWKTIVSPSDRVKVWHQTRYPGDAAKASAIASAVDGYWDTLVGLMGAAHAPLGDGTIIGKDNGGDPRVDIYLAHITNNGEWHPYIAGCDGKVPGFILVNSARSDLKCILSTVAHELMHGIQGTFKRGSGDCNEYRWWKEATSTWAQNYVSRDANCEHGWLPIYLDHPDVSLEHDPSSDDTHKYGAYLFPFYLEESFKLPDLVRDIWQKCAVSSSLKAINDSLPEGLKESWPEFAVYNYNQHPQYLYTDDGITVGARTSDVRSGVPLAGIQNATEQNPNPLEIPVKMDGKGEIVITLFPAVRHLAALYYHFTFPDENARTITFEHFFTAQDEPMAKLQALIRIEGEDWKLEDWTKTKDDNFKIFCRDKKSERLKDLVIIISNSEWQDKTHVLFSTELPRLRASNIGCWRWEGTATATQHDVIPAFSDKSETDTTTFTFERKRFPDTKPTTVELFTLVSADSQWSHSGSDLVGTCHGASSGHYDTSGFDGELTVQLVGDRKYNVISSGAGGCSIDYACDGGFTLPEGCIVSNWLDSGGTERDENAVKHDGTIDGTYEPGEDITGSTKIWTWHMTPMRE